MKCACNDLKCKNEIQHDQDGGTLRVLGYQTQGSEPEILIYVTPASARELIIAMREYLPPVEPTKEGGSWNTPTGEEDEEGIYSEPPSEYFYKCPACNVDELSYADKFCCNCGEKITWNFGHLANQKENI